MKAQSLRFYTISLMAATAFVVLMTGCAATKGHASPTDAMQLSEGFIGDPVVTVIGVGGIPDGQRDKLAQIARQYVSGFLKWSDQAAFIVQRRTSNGYDLGWTVDVCKMVGRDEVGEPRLSFDERRIVTLNRKEHIVDYYNSGGPFVGPLASGPGGMSTGPVAAY